MQPQPATPASEDIVDVRCQGGLHFKVVDGDTIEIKCKHCSNGSSVVLHRITLSPRIDVTTFTFNEPPRGRGARAPRKETS